MKKHYTSLQCQVESDFFLFIEFFTFTTYKILFRNEITKKKTMFTLIFEPFRALTIDVIDKYEFLNIKKNNL